MSDETRIETSAARRVEQVIQSGSEPRDNPGVAVVTGGSRGIGAATALLLAQRGWAVCIGYLSSADAAHEVVTGCKANGSAAVAVAGDLVDADAVAELFDVADRLGTVTALINNAGIVDRRARVDEMAAERLERMFSVNVVSPFLCAKQAIRRMSTRHGGDGGVIVNVSSAAARLGAPNEFVDYAASKGAIDTMTLGLAREVAGEGIRVNAVRPGLIETDIHASGGQPERVERMSPLVPMKRGGQADEVAKAIAWLCSAESSYVTAALIDVAGGR